MSSTRTISVTDQRLARWLIWAALWLRRAAWLRGMEDIWSPVADWAEPMLRQKLRWTRRLILQIIFLRGFMAHPPTQGARQPRAASRFGAKPAPPSGLLRAAVGSRLRRISRGRTASEQIAALFRLLTTIEAEILRMRRRLARGIVRQRRIRHAPRVFSLLTGVSILALIVVRDAPWPLGAEDGRAADTS
jgi:hypothetical protein